MADLRRLRVRRAQPRACARLVVSGGARRSPGPHGGVWRARDGDCAAPPVAMIGPMTDRPLGKRRMEWEMFALSFTALFLEMMVIRWVPSVVHLVAYYANLMLLSSFLGLGAGAMASGRRWNLFGWFPAFLACDIGMLLLDRNTVL